LCEQAPERGRIARRAQACPQLAVTERLRDLGQHGQVLLGRALGNEQEEEERGRDAVRRAEVEAVAGQADDAGDRRAQVASAAARNGDAMTERR
jgi:hypothetical protein